MCRGISYACSIPFRQDQRLISPPSQGDFRQSREMLERVLCQNILPFWYPQVLDLSDGGYKLNHDLQGRWMGTANKRLVTQARTVWFFSRLANTDYGQNKHLEAARHGYEFLYSRMWDKEFGGFYWEVDSSGDVATVPDKHLYGQAFGLYALSEYAIASGDKSAIALARKVFNLLEHHAHDMQYGGYRESFQRDWRPTPPDIRTPFMGISPTIKLMDTHLHLLEAVTMYYLLTKDQIAWERLIELIFIQSNTVVRKTVGGCINKHQRNWTPLHGPDDSRIIFGHDLENIWLLIEACNAAGISNGLLVDLYRTVFSYALKYGFDWKKGGFYISGPFHKTSDRREKIWWVQAEALVSALYMYQLTGEEVYANCFFQTLDWIFKYQADWEHGDWHAHITEDGKPFGNKADGIKSPYHNGRAMIKCLELLQPLSDK